MRRTVVNYVDGTGCFGIELRADITKFTNVIIAGFEEREKKMKSSRKM